MAEKKSAINAEVASTRLREGLPHTQHVGMLKSSLGKAWEQEDHQVWIDKAEKANKLKAAEGAEMIFGYLPFALVLFL